CREGENLLAAHLDTGRTLARAGWAAAALKELQAAYEMSHDLQLQLEIARLQRSLGQNADALISYSLYLTRHPDPDAALRQEAEAAVAELRPLPAEAAVAASEHARAPHLMPWQTCARLRPHLGMQITGWTMLGLGYVGALVSGLYFGVVWSNPNRG